MSECRRDGATHMGKRMVEGCCPREEEGRKGGGEERASWRVQQLVGNMHRKSNRPLQYGAKINWLCSGRGCHQGEKEREEKADCPSAEAQSECCGNTESFRQQEQPSGGTEALGDLLLL